MNKDDPAVLNCCDNPLVTDLAQGLGNYKHLFCRHCKGHYYTDDETGIGRQYTAKEWFNWVEYGESGEGGRR